MLFKGMGFESNEEKAKELFEKSCNLGSASGCKNFRRLKN